MQCMAPGCKQGPPPWSVIFNVGIYFTDMIKDREQNYGQQAPALTWGGYQHTTSPVDTSLLRQSHHVTQNDSPQAAGHCEDRMPIWRQSLHILCCLTCCLTQTMFPDVICDANRLQASMLLDVPVKAVSYLILRHALFLKHCAQHSVSHSVHHSF